MPYIITTNRATPGIVAHDIMPRRAVATLDEARNDLAGYCPVPEHPGRPIGEKHPAATFADSVRNLPESGGTIGPLPDGTVIEVEQVPFHELMIRASIEPPDNGMLDAAILEAFNAEAVR